LSLWLQDVVYSQAINDVDVDVNVDVDVERKQAQAIASLPDS